MSRTTSVKIIRLRVTEPNLTIKELSTRIGVSRQYATRVLENAPAYLFAAEHMRADGWEVFHNLDPRNPHLLSAIETRSPKDDLHGAHLVVRVVERRTRIETMAKEIEALLPPYNAFNGVIALLKRKTGTVLYYPLHLVRNGKLEQHIPSHLLSNIGYM